MATWSDDSSSPASSGGAAIQDEAYPAEALQGYNMAQHVSARSSEDGTNGSLDEPQGPTKMAPRAYQLEMLRESLKRNIIVTMDTGSGKTQVAVLRIMAELERCEPHKIAWFLCPTVSLSSQQFDIFTAQIPAVQSKLLSGEDGLDSWSEQGTWDAALFNVRIVVSTYQVLLDALSHAFVRLGRLALIVFDEAHNCTKKHPGRRIMTEFYHPAKEKALAVPSILGLTASPVMGSNLEGMERLERTLDAVCKSPTRHREELMANVNRPSMFKTSYGPAPGLLTPDLFTENMRRLQTGVKGLSILNDPYIRHLRIKDTEQSRKKIQAALTSDETPSRKQLASFCRRGMGAFQDLGSFAADWYVYEVVRRYTESSENQDALGGSYFSREKCYLTGTLRALGVEPPEFTPGSANMSRKARALIQTLASFDDDPTGIVFVKERTTASILAHLVSIHPATRSRYRVASMVGTSRWSGRTNFFDLSRAEDLTSLQYFRRGRVNLLIATSVIEEGLDMPACNLVVCVDPPPNLKSFVQRRGRARMRSSELHLLVSDESSACTRQWEALEAEMKKRYEDEMRSLQELEQLEASEATGFPPLRVEKTGAQLSMADAKSRLEHFCATLSSRKFADRKPEYIIDDTSDAPLLRATVFLPATLPAGLRSAASSAAWPSEKNACRDAAFQAYKALYHGGLINDNLLPLRESDLSREVEGREGTVDVPEQVNPWIRIAAAWKAEPRTTYRRRLSLLEEHGSAVCDAEMILPVRMPAIESFTLYWGPDALPCTVEMEAGTLMHGTCETTLPQDGADELEHTTTLLSMSFGYRWPMAHRHQLVRFSCPRTQLSPEGIGTRVFVPGEFGVEPPAFLVRDGKSCPLVYQDLLPSKPPIDLIRKAYKGFEDSPEDVPYLVMRSWPKRPASFHKPAQTSPPSSSSQPYPRVLPAPDAKVDTIPMVYARFASAIPSITRALEVRLVATELVTCTKLSELGISDLSLVLTAISAPSAREPTNYERIEFLGDSILKFCVTISCAANYLHFPEGYLSLLKDRLVSNSRLSRAAMDFGLDRFIVAKQFTLKDWRHLYERDLLLEDEDGERTRRLSTKTLADVVEALIGASYLDGGISKALQCISLFLGEAQWQSLEAGRMALYEAAAPSDVLPPTLEPVEELAGYSFSKKSLLVEAMTHSSYHLAGTVGGTGTTTGCLERLEFMGDAILDYMVVTKLFALEPALEHHEMHLLRTALVNADFQGFLAMEWSVARDRFDVGRDLAIRDSRYELALWRFMRHSSGDMAVEQLATERRHGELRERIADALERGTTYPWALLARLRAQKFYSDLFEALIGAVWVDSATSDPASSSYAACEALLERAGLLPYLRRIVRDRVHLLHPKEELGRLADQERVEYVVDAVAPRPEDGEEGDGGGQREFVCRVLVGGRCIVDVGGGVSREEAKTRAAEEAVRILKPGPGKG